MTAKKSTAASAAASAQANFETAREGMMAFGRKATEMGQKSFQEQWKLGKAMQEQAFGAWEKQLDLFRAQADFALDNQKELLKMARKQLETVEELCVEGLDEAVERVRSACEIH